VLVCSECGEPVTARDVHVHPGPGKRQPVRAEIRGMAKTKVRSRAV
jgi:hypothetical protein